MSQHSLLESFRSAFRGIIWTFKNQRNNRVQWAAAFMVLVAAWALDLSRVERIFLIVAIGGALVMEALNTAIEQLVDVLRPRQHPLAALIKETSAGAVLIASSVAFIIGIMVLIPALARFLSSL